MRFSIVQTKNATNAAHEPLVVNAFIADFLAEMIINFVDRLCEKQAVTPNLMAIAERVLAGEFGNGEQRRETLIQAGYDYAAVQEEIRKILDAHTSYDVRSGGGDPEAFSIFRNRSARTNGRDGGPAQALGTEVPEPSTEHRIQRKLELMRRRRRRAPRLL